MDTEDKNIELLKKVRESGKSSLNEIEINEYKKLFKDDYYKHLIISILNEEFISEKDKKVLVELLK